MVEVLVKKKDSKLKVAIFGGSFNPLHLGHIHLLKQVYKKFNLDLIKVVPAFKAPDPSFVKSPAKLPATPLSKSFLVREPTPNQRLMMVRKALKAYPFLEIDNREIKRGGTSYTVDTIEEIKKENPHFKEIFLIIGADQFAQFNKWKRYKTLLKKTNLVVCSRKNYSRTPNFTLPPAVRKIHWVDLKGEWNMSSSEIRKRVGLGLSIQNLVPSLVHQWIGQKGFYQRQIKEKDLIKFCAQTLLEKKAEKVKMFDLRKFSSLPFDFTLTASGLNTQHTKVLALYLGRQVKKEFSLSAWNKEGEKTGEWIVLDYGFLGVHIFYHYTREHYQLEELWKTAPNKTF